MRSPGDRKKGTGFGFGTAAAIAVGLAIFVSLLTSHAVVGSVDVPLVVGVATVMALLACGNPETLVEASVLCLVLGGVAAVALYQAPLSPFWRQLVIAGVSGFCTSAMALAVHEEFFRRSLFEEPSDEPPSSAHADSAGPSEDAVVDAEAGKAADRSDLPIREYDTVRIVGLRVPERPFDGTMPGARLPRVGDVAFVADEYPDGTVVVEMTDDDEGSTVWLANFDKDELERVYRPGEG